MNTETTRAERPAFCTDEHLEYLDRLRERGVTNMFGAGRYVAREYGLDKKKAGAILVYWMRTFSERKEVQ